MKIQINTFAAACYDQNTVAELQAALAGSADAADCTTWGLTPQEWHDQIGVALKAKLSND